MPGTLSQFVLFIMVAVEVAIFFYPVDDYEKFLSNSEVHCSFVACGLCIYACSARLHGELVPLFAEIGIDASRICVFVGVGSVVYTYGSVGRAGVGRAEFQESATHSPVFSAASAQLHVEPQLLLSKDASVGICCAACAAVCARGIYCRLLQVEEIYCIHKYPLCRVATLRSLFEYLCGVE